MAAKVTTKGREMVSYRLRGTPAAGTEPLVVGWGVTPPLGGPFTAAVTDVAPFDEGPENRTSGTSSFATSGGGTTNDTYQVVGTIVATATRAVVETFLSELTTKPFTTTWATAPVGTSGTTGTLAASYTPANGTYVQCRTEVMQVSLGTGTANVTLVRAQNGSAAVAQSNNDVVTLGNPPGTGTIGTTAGSLFAHADFAVVNLSAGDSLSLTWQIQIQS